MASMIAATLGLVCGLYSDVEPIPCAHAHNDYAHERPLHDALANGFMSVEADIFLVDGELRVGHDRQELKPGRTLQALYLDPLFARFKELGGIYKDTREFLLLVDIKADGSAVVPELQKALAPYRPMLTRANHGFTPGDRIEKGAVTVVVSGDRPPELFDSVGAWDLFVDGRLEDLESPLRNIRMLLISDNFGRHFTWRGEGELPARERIKLQLLAQKAHARKHKLRFWAIPDNPAGWGAMLEAGVDLVNTDRLADFRQFWLQRRRSQD